MIIKSDIIAKSIIHVIMKNHLHHFYLNTKNRKFTLMLLIKKLLFMLNDIKTYKSYDNINNDIDKNTLGMKKVILKKSLSSSLMELEKVLLALSLTPLYNLPTGATIYKFYKKLVRLDIIKESYDYCIKKYLKIHKPKIFITDTTLIPNKNGTSDIGYVR